MLNGQGDCEACNYTKQAPGWHTKAINLHGGHTVEITTPTGHQYRSRAPDPPGRVQKPLEPHLERWLREALGFAA